MPPAFLRPDPHTFLPSAQLTAPGQLQELGSLIVGMKTETLLTLTSDRLLSSLPAMAQHTPGLNPPQANAIATKLWVQLRVGRHFQINLKNFMGKSQFSYLIPFEVFSVWLCWSKEKS